MSTPSIDAAGPTTAEPGLDIFISYAREDFAVANRLVEALTAQRSWKIWLDTRIRAGALFEDEIEARLLESRCVVVIWSKQSVNRVWVRDEARVALKRNVIVPVSLGGAVPPLGFQSIQARDLSAWGLGHSEDISALVADIEAVIGRGASSVSSVETKRRRSPATFVVGVVGVATATLGIGLWRSPHTASGALAPSAVGIPSGVGGNPSTKASEAMSAEESTIPPPPPSLPSSRKRISIPRTELPAAQNVPVISPDSEAVRKEQQLMKETCTPLANSDIKQKCIEEFQKEIDALRKLQ